MQATLSDLLLHQAVQLVIIIIILYDQVITIIVITTAKMWKTHKGRC